MMNMINKMPGLDVMTRILQGVGFTIGALALTECQAQARSLFAVIAKTKTNASFCWFVYV